LLLHFLSPEFNPISQGISYYALGKFGWLFTLSLVFIGVASLAVVALCWKESPTISGRVGLSLVVLWILLMEAGAFFEMDPPGHGPTFSGRVHSIAGISFLLLPPAAFLIERSLLTSGPRLCRRPAAEMFNTTSHKAQRRRGWILAWLVLAASCLLLLFNGFLVNLGIGGIIQRGYWLTIVAWLFSLARTNSELATNTGPSTGSR
jgi:hypothetical protein